VSTLGPPAPARADTPADPAARLQIVLKNVHVYDDHDFFGRGQMAFGARICHLTAGERCTATEADATVRTHFSVDSGDNVTMPNVVPEYGADMTPDVSPEAGVPVYAGERYRFLAGINENTDDDMGSLLMDLDEEHGWGIGTYTIRSQDFDYGRTGDFDLTFEIRRVPLPDLWVKSVYVQPAGDTSWVCADVWNAGQRPVAPTTLIAQTEGKILDTFTLPDLDVNWSYPHCIRRSALPAHKHNLVFSVDDARQVPEMEEYNNVGVITVEADPTGTAAATGPVSAAPVAAPSPEQQPDGGQADPSKEEPDLTVRAIKVNGQAPDGKDACKDGKNAVTVVVRNAGKGDAAGFSVRLGVDGNDRDTTVDGLGAGQEREVRFDGVQLKAGQHALTAVADPDHAVGESKDGNNELKATARCAGGR
jgi:hypothetical protein